MAIDRIKSNISTMIEKGATEQEIDAYVASENMTPELLKAAPVEPASPYTKAPWFNDYKALKASDVPVAEGPTDPVQRDKYLAVTAKRAYDNRAKNPPQRGFGAEFDKSIAKQGGWGLSEETRDFLGEQDTPGFDIRNVLPAAADLAFRGFQGLMGGVEAGATNFDKNLEETGIPQLSEDLTGHRLAPGGAVMALLEAFPDGGLAHGFATPRGDVLSKDLRAKYNQEATVLFDNGATAEQMNAWAKDRKLAPFPEKDINAAIVARDAKGMASKPLPAGADPVAAVDALNGGLAQEAANFKGTTNPTVEDLFPVAGDDPAKMAALQAQLEGEAAAFKGRNPEEPAPPPQPDAHVQEISPAVRPDTSAEDAMFLQQFGLTPSHFAGPEEMASAVEKMRGAAPIEQASYEGAVIGSTPEAVAPTVSKKAANALFKEATTEQKPSTVAEFGSQLRSDAEQFLASKGEPAPATPAVETAPAAVEAPVAEAVPAFKAQPSIERINKAEDLDTELSSPEPVDSAVDELPARQRRAALAEKLGYSPEEFEQTKGVALNSVQAERGVQLVDQSNAKIAGLLDRATKGELAEGDLADLVGEIAKFKAINDKLTGTISEGAKILDVAAARNKGPKALAKMLEGTAIRSVDDARLLAERLKTTENNPAARRKLLNAVTDPRAEDYALSLWYNALLSAPATHVVNFIGNATHMGLEGFNKGLASVIGQAGRKADRVYGREVAGNMYGVVKSFLEVESYKRVGRAFTYRGEDGGKGAKAILPGPLTLLETPSRMLNAGDEIWSNMSKMSSVYGQASKIAAREGKGFGKNFYDRVQELVKEPTPEMLERAQNTSDFLTFRDDASGLAKGIEKLRSRRIKDTVGTRVLKTGSRLFVPFVQTPDRLIAATLRNSPAGALRPKTIGQIAKGGEEGNRATARIMTGSALTGYLVYLADKGELTGTDNENFAKAKEEQSGDFQANSMKIGDKSVSFRGIDPFSTNATIVADLVEKYKAGKLSDEGYANGVRQVVATVGHGLSDSTYTGNIANFLQMFEPGYKGKMATENLAAGTASTLTTPAIVKAATNIVDPVARDTTGDGSLTDRMLGRVKSGWPGLSEELPQKMDVYGRGISKPDTVGGPLTRMVEKASNTDPAVIELQRLSKDAGDTTVVSGVKRSDLKNFKATAEDVQKYQQLSGTYILESVRALQKSGEWKKMNDEERKKEIKGIMKDMRAVAREELFPQFYGGNNNK